MPREQINYPAAVMETGADGGAPSVIKAAGPALHVSWHASPAGTVQIRFDANPDFIQEAADFPDPETGRSAMYTDELTRAEINKMIRTLRRARDQAYGKDE